MVDKHDNNNQIDPSLLDTQRLLLGVELPEDAPFDLEDIVAEYGSTQPAPPTPEKPASPVRKPASPAQKPAPPVQKPSVQKPPAPKPEPSPPKPAPLSETQRLLLGVELPEHTPFDLEDIVAEYSGTQPVPPTPEEPAPSVPEPAIPAPEPAPVPPAPAPEPAPKPPARKGRPRRPKANPAVSVQSPPPAEPPAAPEPSVPPPPPPDIPAGADIGKDEAALDKSFWEEFAVTEGLYLDETQGGLIPGTLPPDPPPIRFAPLSRPDGASSEEESAPEPPSQPEPEPEPPSISMEDVVASTVDAVKEEQEKRQKRFRKHLEKVLKKKQPHSVKRREPSSRHALPEFEDEPPAMETASRHKRRYRECRRSLTGAVVMLIVLWAPWVLEQSGIAVPFFSDSADNAGMCVLVSQAVISILCWPVYRAAIRMLRDGSWTIYATALLATIVTLLDEMTMLVLPERTAAAPLGGLAAAMSVFALWGLTGWNRGMAETFRIAAMGEPTRVVDCTPLGIARGHGTGEGFYTRAAMEDTSSQWQRLLLPVLAAASLVFAVLASVGQDRNQDFLWCWSVVLCASSSLVFPLSFGVPFGRVAAHLARSGTAVAGMYGASAFTADKRLTVTDLDLFPSGSVRLSGIKLYGEEQNHALSYAATLAVQAGGLLGRLFQDASRNARVPLQSLEHFHIHEDGGFGGMIHGETVLVGSPSFMRRQGVRLPPSLSSKTAICLSIDGQLGAVFTVKYAAAEPVDYALKILQRNGFHLVLATRDGNLNPKFLKARFGAYAASEMLELSDRLAISDPEREAEGAEGLIYRDGILPYAFLAVDSRRLCQTVLAGNLLSIFSSIAGSLLGFYLTFSGSYSVLTPILLITYMLLWVVPMLPMVLTVDKG